MDYTKLSLINCHNLACSEFGLENPHTIAIAQLVDLVADDMLDKERATTMAQIIYDHGANSLYYNDEWDEDDEPLEDDVDESGFDPYMGCYTGDC
jgi:hypothetical protein